MANRVKWIDVAKGIGMIAVVFGHSDLPSVVQKWIWSYHMPLFFFISGVVFSLNNYKSWIDFVKRRNTTLLVPYFYFSLIVMVIFLFLLDPEKRLTLFKEIVINGWGAIALWFIPILYFTEIVFYPLQQKTNRLSLAVSILSSLLIALYLSKIDFHLPYTLEVVFVAMFFYGVGYLLYSIVGKLLTNLSILHGVLLFIISITINIILCFANTVKLDLAANRIGNYFYGIGAAFAGIFAIIVLSNLIEKTGNVVEKALTYIGKNTLILLGMHQIVKLTLNAIFSHIEGTPLLLTFLRHALLWIILIILIESINKYLPFLVGRKKKVTAPSNKYLSRTGV